MHLCGLNIPVLATSRRDYMLSFFFDKTSKNKKKKGLILPRFAQRLASFLQRRQFTEIGQAIAVAALSLRALVFSVN